VRRRKRRCIDFALAHQQRPQEGAASRADHDGSEELKEELVWGGKGGKGGRCQEAKARFDESWALALGATGRVRCR